MFSYFAGGPLADRFHAMHLLVAALLMTSLGGIVMATIPSIGILTLLYGFWGLTTIFLFWGALIKTTRELGADSQGQAFGLLDGGRGLFAAVVSSISVLVFAAMLPEVVETATMEERANALGNIIYLFCAAGLVSALLVWLFVPIGSEEKAAYGSMQMEGLKRVMKMKAVWCQALIVLCAYVAYKSTDDFSLYARDAFGYNDVEAAQIGTVSFWMRPIAAVCAGLLADRFSSRIMLITSFTVVLLGSLVIAGGMIAPGMLWFLLVTIAATSAGIYGLRGIYFAIFGEAAVPAHLTGTAVGVVSFVGFTPDIFMGPLMGYLIDASPGATGHQHVFAVVAFFALTGLVSTLLFHRITLRKVITDP